VALAAAKGVGKTCRPPTLLNALFSPRTPHSFPSPGGAPSKALNPNPNIPRYQAPQPSIRGAPYAGPAGQLGICATSLPSSNPPPTSPIRGERNGPENPAFRPPAISVIDKPVPGPPGKPARPTRQSRMRPPKGRRRGKTGLHPPALSPKHGPTPNHFPGPGSQKGGCTKKRKNTNITKKFPFRAGPFQNHARSAGPDRQPPAPLVMVFFFLRPISPRPPWEGRGQFPPRGAFFKNLRPGPGERPRTRKKIKKPFAPSGRPIGKWAHPLPTAPSVPFSGPRPPASSSCQKFCRFFICGFFPAAPARAMKRISLFVRPVPHVQSSLWLSLHPRLGGPGEFLFFFHFPPRSAFFSAPAFRGPAQSEDAAFNDRPGELSSTFQNGKKRGTRNLVRSGSTIFGWGDCGASPSGPGP